MKHLIALTFVFFMFGNDYYVNADKIVQFDLTNPLVIRIESERIGGFWVSYMFGEESFTNKTERDERMKQILKQINP